MASYLYLQIIYTFNRTPRAFLTYPLLCYEHCVGLRFEAI